jgi:hypothetical protein
VAAILEVGGEAVRRRHRGRRSADRHRRARSRRRSELPWHAPEAAAVARHKLWTRERLRGRGAAGPWFSRSPARAHYGGATCDRQPATSNEPSVLPLRRQAGSALRKPRRDARRRSRVVRGGVRTPSCAAAVT